MISLVLLSLVLGQITAEFTSTSVPFSNAPYRVQFTYQKTPSVDSVLWDFGDGRTSTEISPNHTYLNSGTFDVKLTVFYELNGVDTSVSVVKPNHVVTYYTKKAPWAAREGHASVVFDNKMWVLGGHSADANRTNVRFNDVWSTEDGSIWVRVLSTAPWDPRSSFTATSFDGKIWIIGGITGEGEASGEVWWTSNGTVWTRITDGDAITPRYSHAAAVFSNKIYILGGRNFEGGLPDVTTFDGTDFEVPLAQGPWGTLCGHSMCVTEVSGVDTLIVSGGSDGDGLNRSVFLSSDGINWRSNAFGKLTQGYAPDGVSTNPKLVGWSEYTKSFVTFLEDGDTGLEPCIVGVSTQWQHTPSVTLIDDVNQGELGSYVEGVTEISPYIDSTIGLGYFITALDDGNLGCEPYLIAMAADPEDCTITNVGNIAEGIRPSNPHNFRSFGMAGVFFLANDYIHGEEIWSYHNVEGLSLFSDINNSSESSGIRFLERVQNSLRGVVFVVLADNPIGSGDLFYTIRCGKGSWEEDLSKPSDFSAPEVVPGDYANEGNIFFPTIFPMGVVFVSGVDGARDELWSLSISDSITVQKLYGFNPEDSTDVLSIKNVVRVGDNIFVFVEGTGKLSVWKTDGIVEPTKAYDVEEIPLIDYESKWVVMGSSVYFPAAQSSSGKELWKASVTEMSLLKDVFEGTIGSLPSLMCTNGSYIYFSATTSKSGNEVWRTDGTSDGTSLFYDAWFGTKSSKPSEIAIEGKDLLFVAEDNVDNRQWFYVQDNDMAPYSRTVARDSRLVSETGEWFGDAYLQLSLDNNLYDVNVPKIVSAPWYRSTPEESVVLRVDSVNPSVIGTDGPVEVTIMGDFSTRTSDMSVVMSNDDDSESISWDIVSDTDSEIHAISSTNRIGDKYLYIQDVDGSNNEVRSNRVPIKLCYGNQGRLGNVLVVAGAGCDSSKLYDARIEGYSTIDLSLPMYIYPDGNAVVYTGEISTVTWKVYTSFSIDPWPSSLKVRYCTSVGMADPKNDTELTVSDSSTGEVSFTVPSSDTPDVLYVYLSQEYASNPLLNNTSNCRPLYVINQHASITQESHVFAEAVMLPADVETNSCGTAQFIQRGDLSVSNPYSSFRLLVEHNVDNPTSVDVYDSSYKVLFRLTAPDLSSPLNFALTRSHYNVLNNFIDSSGSFTENIRVAVRSVGYDFGEVRGILSPKDYAKIPEDLASYPDIMFEVDHSVPNPTGMWIEKDGEYVAPVVCSYESPFLYKMPVSTILSLSDGYTASLIGIFIMSSRIELVIANAENPRGLVRAKLNICMSLPNEAPPSGFLMNVEHSSNYSKYLYAVIEDFDGNSILQTHFSDQGSAIQCSYGLGHALIMLMFPMFSDRVKVRLCDAYHPEGLASGLLTSARFEKSDNRFIESLGYPVANEYVARYFPDANPNEFALMVSKDPGGYSGSIPILVSGYSRQTEYIDYEALKTYVYMCEEGSTITLEASNNPTSFYFVKWIDSFDGDLLDRMIRIKMVKNREVTAVFSTSPPGSEGEGEGEVTSFTGVVPNSAEYTEPTEVVLSGEFTNPDELNFYFSKTPGKYYPEFDHQGKYISGSTSTILVRTPYLNSPTVSEIYITPKGEPETVSEAHAFTFEDVSCEMHSLSTYTARYASIPLRVYKDTFLSVKILPYFISANDFIMTIYCDSFDPDNPDVNLMAVNDDGYGAYSLPKFTSADNVSLEEGRAYVLVIYSKRSAAHLTTPQQSTFVLEFGDDVRPLSSDVWYTFMNDVPMPSPGTGMTAVPYEDKIWMVGGFRGNESRSSIQVYDPESIFSGIFKEYYATSKEFSYISNQTSNVFDNRIWFFGGGGGIMRRDVVYFTSSQREPEVDFFMLPVSGDAPLKVTYTDETDSGEYPITEWLWNFGDGVVSADSSGEHTYFSAGTYDVSLTVTTDIAIKTITKEDYVEVTTP